LPTVLIDIIHAIVAYIFEIKTFNSYVTITGCVLILSLIVKDLYGNSFGKRVFGLRIVSVIDGQKPKLNQLILRNIFVFLVPLEAILVIGRPDQRRIGDFLAKTKVIRKNEYWV
jgi:uncharacterized RDD family membrane protein YckC